MPFNPGHFPLLIAFSGLPGVGKTTISKALCPRLCATYVRVDVIESALRASSKNIYPCDDAGYLAAAAIAKSNLDLGQTVIADTVNPIAWTRNLWSQTADQSHARLINIEVICSDGPSHRARVEERQPDLEDHPLPDWESVQAREYEPWAEIDLRLDSFVFSIEQAVDSILAHIDQFRN